jgi:hypothetical protein
MPRLEHGDHGGWIEVVQKMIKCPTWWSFGDQMGSRQRYNHRAIWFCTQDTIEGVSDLGSISRTIKKGQLSDISIFMCL